MLFLLAILLGSTFAILSCMGLFGIDSNKEESTVNNQQVALNAGGFGSSASNFTGAHIEYGDARIAEKGLDTANALANASLETVYYTLGALQTFQDRGLRTVDTAVGASQSIAAKAAPVNAEVIANTNSKTILIAAGILAVVLLFRKR